MPTLHVPDALIDMLARDVAQADPHRTLTSDALAEALWPAVRTMLSLAWREGRDSVGHELVQRPDESDRRPAITDPYAAPSPDQQSSSVQADEVFTEGALAQAAELYALAHDLGIGDLDPCAGDLDGVRKIARALVGQQAPTVAAALRQAELTRHSLSLPTATWTISFPATLPAARDGWVADLLAAAGVGSSH